MARKQQTDKTPESVTFSVEIPVAKEHMPVLAELCQDKSLNDPQIVQALAYTSLLEMGRGGLLLRADEVKRIEDASGVSLGCGEDILPYLSEQTGIEEGCIKVSVRIDPSYEAPYREIAAMQQRPIEELFQEAMDMVLANEWAYEIPVGERPIHILMPPAAKQELEEILGAKFSTGMDLAALVKKSLGGSAGLFDDLSPSNVGHEVLA
jgi:hypothetical protein